MKTEDVNRIKEQYPRGTRVRCIDMRDCCAVPCGTLGTVYLVDDIGTVHVNWDNGQKLGLIIGEDCFYPVLDEHECCICGRVFEGYGNNPEPVKQEGVCCDDCNTEVVIPARLESLLSNIDRILKGKEQNNA